MSGAHPAAAGLNPFSTRFLQPAVRAFRGPDPALPDQLVLRLRAAGGWGQIVGPHGSGKTTLLHALIPRLRAQGKQVVHWTLHAGQRSRALPRDAWTSSTQVVVDGYEQLGWWARRRLRAACRRRGAGLLVTAHTPVGLPTLWQTSAPLELAQQLVAELTADGPPRIQPEDVERAWRRQGQNLRECFFELYDLYEQRGGRAD